MSRPAEIIEVVERCGTLVLGLAPPQHLGHGCAKLLRGSSPSYQARLA